MPQTTLKEFYKVTSRKSVNVKNNVEKNVEKASTTGSPIIGRKKGQGKKLTAKTIKGLRNNKLFKAFIRQLAENILFPVSEESHSSKMDINKSPTKVTETTIATSSSTKYISPVRTPQHTTTHSGSKFSPKTSSPTKDAFDKSQRNGKLARRKLFKDTTEELISQVIDNLNLAKEGAIANNEINLEKVYASKKFDYKYKSINTAASTRYEIDDVIIPKDTYSLHFFLAVSTVFSKPVNCGYFDEDELDYIYSLLTLSKDAQALFIRMLKRKHTWHRTSSIKYDEVSKDLGPIFDELVSRSVFKSGMEEEDLSILLNLLQVDEIRKLCQESKINGSKKKEDYIQSILKLSKTKSLFPGMLSPATKLRASVNKRLGRCVMLNGRVKEMVDKIITLLIPNRDPTETLSDVFHTILRVETNEIKFPQVTISDLPIFAGKQHLLDYVEARNALSDVLSAIEKKQWQTVQDRGSLAAERLPLILEVETQSLKDSTLPNHIRHFMPGYTWLKVLHKSIDVFKKSKNTLPKAIEHLQTLIRQDCHMKHRKGQWYAELIKIEMYHKKDLVASVQSLSDAVAYKDLTEVDKLDLLERAEMLAKRKTGISQDTKNTATNIANALGKMSLTSLTNSIAIKGTLCGNTSQGKSKWCISNGIDEQTYGSVEDLALNYYQSEGYIKGVHCEGAFPVTLFGTLFWDEIYNMDVPGACVSLYQDAPLDLYSSEFYENRKDRIDMKLQIVRDFDVETLSRHLKHKFDMYCEYKSISNSQGTPFENSNRLEEIVLCLGVEGIVRICERLLHNYTLWRAGFPDLIVWNAHTKQYKIVEVKGPGDSLSTKQKLWLTYLNQLGLNTEVCYCQSSHTNGGRKRKREEIA
ncbi:fanconi-associated nuclease 1-like [Linepithema humile]|uniref:fanconi-associated nuclease 1-like n=1 Tax=Linepithema humile TaxID=83485 RepID=UPI00351E8910